MTEANPVADRGAVVRSGIERRDDEVRPIQRERTGPRPGAGLSYNDGQGTHTQDGHCAGHA
jgi:hypothetical protein